MKKLLLLKPHTTLAALVAGLGAMAGQAVTTIVSLMPLESMKELVMVRPWILGVDTVLGFVAVACLVLCAIGRSIEPFIDDAK